MRIFPWYLFFFLPVNTGFLVRTPSLVRTYDEYGRWMSTNTTVTQQQYNDTLSK
jgi:hypothetical protein